MRFLIVLFVSLRGEAGGLLVAWEAGADNEPLVASSDKVARCGLSEGESFRCKRRLKLAQPPMREGSPWPHTL